MSVDENQLLSIDYEDVQELVEHGTIAEPEDDPATMSGVAYVTDKTMHLVVNSNPEAGVDSDSATLLAVAFSHELYHGSKMGVGWKDNSAAARKAQEPFAKQQALYTANRMNKYYGIKNLSQLPDGALKTTLLLTKSYMGTLMKDQ